MTHKPTEELLARYGATYELDPALPISRIDLVASVTNQSRFEPIDQPTVDRYLAALEDGAEFPPIVVRRLPPKTTKARAQLVILGGNHRARAHLDAGRETIAAYVITVDDLVALEIAYADNATHGLPPSDAERLAHAVDLVERGRTQQDAARTVGIHPQKLTKHFARTGVDRRATRTGVGAEYARVPSSVRYRLSAIPDDRVFTKVVRTIATEQLGTVAITSLIGDVNAQPNVTAAVDVIAAHVRQHRAASSTERRAGRPSHNPLLTLRTALGVIKGTHVPDVLELATTAADRRDLHDALVAAGRRLMQIDKQLQSGGAK